MYFGDDPIPNCYELPGSGVHQSTSNFAKSNGYACNSLLGKRCTILDHAISDKQAKDHASHVKKQKLAMHFNTRHMVQYHPNSTVQHHQHGTLASIQGSANQSFSFQEPQPNSITGIKQSEATLEIPATKNSTASPSKKMNVSSPNAIGHTHAGDIGANVQSTNAFAFGQNGLTAPFDTNTPVPFNNTFDGQGSTSNNASDKVKSTLYTRQREPSKPCNIFLLPAKPSKKPSIIPSRTILPAPNSDYVAASNSQGMVSHMDTNLNAAQAKSVKMVQRWANAMKYICNVRKQLWEFKLFGDEPTFTKDAPDLLKLLKEIDQQKNQVTCGEEHVTGLIKAIFRVWEICENSTDEESIKLAEKILDNFLQRFQNVRFHEWLTVQHSRSEGEEETV